MPSLFRRSLAELLGTFALVFIGAGSVASKYFPEAGYGIFGVAVAHGLVLAVMVTALLGISGGHLNPAVTLGLVAVRRTDLRTGLAYIVAQLLGGVLAALLIKMVYPLGVVRPISLGTPTIANTIQFHQAMMLEGVMAFFLISAYFGTCLTLDTGENALPKTKPLRPSGTSRRTPLSRLSTTSRCSVVLALIASV